MVIGDGRAVDRLTRPIERGIPGVVVVLEKRQSVVGGEIEQAQLTTVRGVGERHQRCPGRRGCRRTGRQRDGRPQASPGVGGVIQGHHAI